MTKGLLGIGLLLAGGLVAGLNAGLDYNTWPSMDGGWLPDGVLALSPWWLNAFENAATVQFDHRMLAYATTICIAGLWWRCRDASPPTAMAAICRRPLSSTFIAVLKPTPSCSPIRALSGTRTLSKMTSAV